MKRAKITPVLSCILLNAAFQEDSPIFFARLKLPRLNGNRKFSGTEVRKTEGNFGITLKVGIGLNSDLPIEQITQLAQKADQLGYDSFWLHEHSFGRDSVTNMAVVSSVTRKLRLGFGCLSPYVRHPINLAMTVATLQEMSSGRMILGIGTGFPMRQDLMGIKHEKPIAALKETIDICRELWSGKTVSFAGKVFDLKNVKPLLSPMSSLPPIYIAGWKSHMLMLTGRYANGYVAKGGESTQSLKEIVAEIRSTAMKVRRSIREIETSAYLLTHIDKSKEDALRRARQDPFVIYMMSVQDDYLYEGTGIDPKLKQPIAQNFFKGKVAEASQNVNDEMLEAFTLVGTTDDVLDRVDEYRKSGLDLPILQPISMKQEDMYAVLNAGAKLIAA